MIMYRQGIPLLPAEELGYHLGLTLPPDETELFYQPRTAPQPPSSAGYGTQVFNPQYDPNKVFHKLGIPLTFTPVRASEIADAADLLRRLRLIETEDRDALLCFNHGVMRGEYQPYSGHVTVFDRVIDDQVRLVDASWKQPKWRMVEAELLMEAIRRHDETGGIWHFDRTS